MMARVLFINNNLAQRDPIARNGLRDRAVERAFARFVDEEKPELIHIHHLVGLSLSLARMTRRAGIPIIQQLQDWWSLCARVNLFDFQGRRCSGPGLSKCARCAPLTRIPFANRALHLARRSATRAALSAADAFVMGSEFIRDDYARARLLPAGTPAFVIPYGIDISPAPRVPRAGGPLRFGFVGAILPHKGLHVAVEAFRGIDPAKAVLRAWGNENTVPDYSRMLRERGAASFTIEGRFEESAKPQIFASIDVLLVPSIGLESFSLAAREALACGVPVVATWDGALTQMFEPGLCGEFFPSGDAAALHAIIRRLAAAPEIVAEWASRIPRPKSTAEHAEEIEEVYRRVVDGK